MVLSPWAEGAGVSGGVGSVDEGEEVDGGDAGVTVDAADGEEGEA